MDTSPLTDYEALRVAVWLAARLDARKLGRAASVLNSLHTYAQGFRTRNTVSVNQANEQWEYVQACIGALRWEEDWMKIIEYAGHYQGWLRTALDKRKEAET
jgi:hypothetical protein